MVLLAPTGRAAKVIASYAGQKAFTVHKCIYRPMGEGGDFSFTLRDNKASHTLFIVDEASMIGEEASFAGRSLLSDLIEFVSIPSVSAFSHDQTSLDRKSVV